MEEVIYILKGYFTSLSPDVLQSFYYLEDMTPIILCQYFSYPCDLGQGQLLYLQCLMKDLMHWTSQGAYI